MDLIEIQDAAALESAFGVPRFLLFKHSKICPISARAFAEYRGFLEENPDGLTAWLDVVGQRPLSQSVAERTGVQHESPQALVLSRGEVIWHASHAAITQESLRAAWTQGS